MNILCNPTGTKYRFRAIDWLVEHNNLYPKVSSTPLERSPSSYKFEANFWRQIFKPSEGTNTEGVSIN